MSVLILRGAHDLVVSKDGFIPFGAGEALILWASLPGPGWYLVGSLGEALQISSPDMNSVIFNVREAQDVAVVEGVGVLFSGTLVLILSMAF